ncbi:MAG: helix-turn-helix domain-containing protein [Methylococcaceae bacterium]|nr:helix-turn-helix domain-containing protein [Methylococcaceae bacterium]
MNLTLDEAAIRLGKSKRQVRYLIDTGKLPAKKSAGRWFIDSNDLPLSEGQQSAAQRKQRQLQAAVEEALEIDPKAKSERRYSVLDMKAFNIALENYRRLVDQLGEKHASCRALRASLEYLSQGCHRFEHSAKAEAYRLARDQASLAICELVIDPSRDAGPLIEQLEQNLMPAFAGLLRRVDSFQRSRRRVL